MLANMAPLEIAVKRWGSCVGGRDQIEGFVRKQRVLRAGPVGRVLDDQEGTTSHPTSSQMIQYHEFNVRMYGCPCLDILSRHQDPLHPLLAVRKKSMHMCPLLQRCRENYVHSRCCQKQTNIVGQKHCCPFCQEPTALAPVH